MSPAGSSCKSPASPVRYWSCELEMERLSLLLLSVCDGEAVSCELEKLLLLSLSSSAWDEAET